MLSIHLRLSPMLLLSGAALHGGAALAVGSSSAPSWMKLILLGLLIGSARNFFLSSTRDRITAVELVEDGAVLIRRPEAATGPERLMVKRPSVCWTSPVAALLKFRCLPVERHRLRRHHFLLILPDSLDRHGHRLLQRHLRGWYD